MNPPPKIDIICLGRPVNAIWSLGQIFISPKKVACLAQLVQEFTAQSEAEFVLFWDPELGLPDPRTIVATTQLPGDAWHAGLCLGLGGHPKVMNFVNPTWMLQVDPLPEQEATSWRLSLSACLLKTDVLRQLGGPDPQYPTLAGAGLEMGYRYLQRGVFIRSAPSLVSRQIAPAESKPSIRDELLFVLQWFGKRWLHWAVFRAVFHGYPLYPLLKNYLSLIREVPSSTTETYHHSLSVKPFEADSFQNTVTVLIPTLERYSYLRNELRQLRSQTILPLEIMIMDQTPQELRETTLSEEFPDLPLRIFYQDVQGQCTGWNQGLLAGRGRYFLFLGDDADEITPDFIEGLMRTLHGYGADMVGCLVDEVGVTSKTDEPPFLRISDSFPIALIQRQSLEKAGLMDYAFDRGARADQDLGIRCYQSGALMVFDPEIRVLHHRAPRGGLRTHKVRVITRGSSRKNLWQRHLPYKTELYLALRYFSRTQLIEMLLHRTLGTLSGTGSSWFRVAKLIVGIFCLPDTLYQTWRRYQEARQMLTSYPQIPSLQVDFE